MCSNPMCSPNYSHQPCTKAEGQHTTANKELPTKVCLRCLTLPRRSEPADAAGDAPTQHPVLLDEDKQILKNS